MGTLVVRKYPTKLFLKAADHTYVECGTGAKGWACWGGKSGGGFLRSASGSTRRANDIAGIKETAGVTCYLINGVCHQAANRILDQSKITVDGARGYSLSVSLFGVLGRKKGALGLCNAPFNNHAGVTGDVPECVEATGGAYSSESAMMSSNPGRHDFEDLNYMVDVHALYDRVEVEASDDPERLFEDQMDHFKLFVSHKFSHYQDRIISPAYHQLMLARENFERRRLRVEEEFVATRNGRTFVEKFDELTLAFQDEVAQALDEQSYRTLLDLSADERIVLSDPEIVERVYGGTPDSPGVAT